MKHFIAVSLVTGALASILGCAQAEHPQPVDLEPAVNDIIGKHFWERTTLNTGHICTAPAFYCSAGGQGFVVDGFVRSGAVTYARVTLDGGGEAFLIYAPGHEKLAWMTEDPQAVTTRGSAAHITALRSKIEELKREHCLGGMLRLGMTKAQAISAWCYPEHANSTETAGGTSEQWVYPGRGYLYFHGDRLAAIQRTD